MLHSLRLPCFFSSFIFPSFCVITKSVISTLYFTNKSSRSENVFQLSETVWFCEEGMVWSKYEVNGVEGRIPVGETTRSTRDK